jgi:hypothetical protein
MASGEEAFASFRQEASACLVGSGRMALNGGDGLGPFLHSP